MSETLTPRFGFINWGASTDGPSRVEFNTNFTAAETYAAIDVQGTFASRPAAGIRGRYYWDTDNSYLWRDNGSGWDLTTSKTRDLLVKSSAVGVVPLTINAIASQTASLLDLQVNSVSKFSVSAAGTVTANIVNGKSASWINDTVGNPVIFGKGVSGQTALLLSLQDNTGSNMLSVSPTGLVTTPNFASSGSGAATGMVVNANSASSVAGFTNWSGQASLEVRGNRSGIFNDFLYFKHDVADNSAATRRLGLVLKVGAEDSTGATRSAAIYLRSTAALFDSPSLRIDVRDTNMWDMVPTTGGGSVTPYPVYANGAGAYFRSSPGGTTGGLQIDSTWIGSQGSGLAQYFRTGSTGAGFYWYGAGTHSTTSGDPGSGGTVLASLGLDSDTLSRFTVNRLTVTAGDDAGPTTTNPVLMIGQASGPNMIFDNDEIVVRNNGVIADMQIQHEPNAVLKMGIKQSAIFINDTRITITSDGTQPSTFIAYAQGDIWIDSRSVGGVFTRSGSSWVKL